jgi:hypothetical protein
MADTIIVSQVGMEVDVLGAATVYVTQVGMEVDVEEGAPPAEGGDKAMSGLSGLSGILT